MSKPLPSIPSDVNARTNLPQGWTSSVEHYENFPVASWLVPKHLRPAIIAIYQFARMADDFADEGDLEPAERLAHLFRCRQQLESIQRGQADRTDRIFGPLAASIEQYQLPLDLFFDLLSAFEQDVLQQRWPDEASITDYCRRSANPIGRLMLALVGIRSTEQLQQSDAICTGLQRINFLQDFGLDWKRGRLYLPLDLLKHFSVQESDIETAVSGAGPAAPALRALLARENRAASVLLRDGAPLCRSIAGRLGLEITATVAGGAQILRRMSQLDFDTTRVRPVLGLQDWLIIGFRTLTRRPVP
jgi:squalene synthase HpnC